MYSVHSKPVNIRLLYFSSKSVIFFFRSSSVIRITFSEFPSMCSVLHIIEKKKTVAKEQGIVYPKRMKRRRKKLTHTNNESKIKRKN